MASLSDRKQEAKHLFYQGKEREMQQFLEEAIKDSASQEDKWDLQLLHFRY